MSPGCACCLPAPCADAALPWPLQAVRTVADALRASRGAWEHLVLDPVLVATSGHSLAEADAVQAMRDHLMPLATVVTPNLPEASALLGGRPVDTVEDMQQVGCAHAGSRAAALCWNRVRAGTRRVLGELRAGAGMLAGPATSRSASSTMLHSLVPGDSGGEQLCHGAVIPASAEPADLGCRAWPRSASDPSRWPPGTSRAGPHSVVVKGGHTTQQDSGATTEPASVSCFA